MDQPDLFELLPECPTQTEPPPADKPQLRLAQGQHVVTRTPALDEILPFDDDARVVWAFVEQCDLSELYTAIHSVESRPGHNAADPKILFALWLFATLRGVGSAREVDRLRAQHPSYQWLCGGVSLNDCTLADFRVDHAAILDRLLTEQLAGLMRSGAVTVQRVAGEGVRTRASARKSSFRRRPTLKQCLAEAKQQVERLKAEVYDDPDATSRREKTAKQRAVEERLTKVTAVLAACAEVQAANDKQGNGSLGNPARPSTTDPEARELKMPKGGRRPASKSRSENRRGLSPFVKRAPSPDGREQKGTVPLSAGGSRTGSNMRFATDTESQLTAAVDVTNHAVDAGELSPTVEEVDERIGVRLREMLADGGIASKDDIEQLRQEFDRQRAEWEDRARVAEANFEACRQLLDLQAAELEDHGRRIEEQPAAISTQASSLALRDEQAATVESAVTPLPVNDSAPTATSAADSWWAAEPVPQEDWCEEDVFARLRSYAPAKTGLEKERQQRSTEGVAAWPMGVQSEAELWASARETVADDGVTFAPPTAAQNDESIDDYMARLMGRIRGSSGSIERPAKPQVETKPAVSVQPLGVAKAARHDAEHGSDAPATPVIAPGPAQLVARSAPPELTIDLKAMRELANFTTRGAIDVHAGRWSKAAAKKLAAGIITLGCGFWLMFRGTTLASVSHASGLVGVVAGIYWISQAAAAARRVRGVGWRAAKFAKTEAHATSPVEAAETVDPSAAGAIDADAMTSADAMHP